MGIVDEILGRDRATRQNRLVTGGILLVSAAALYYLLNPKDARKQGALSAPPEGQNAVVALRERARAAARSVLGALPPWRHTHEGSQTSDAVHETKERTQAAVDAAVREARGGDSGRRS
ncbi:hypothetical protein WJX81_005855 [Elliptochloris bilobata]|uniref:YtxH domain-containing protein n=1 Tax=Elliptochloris bilobata TaxID=381761 RepID=A0AAW1QXB2_9CHLO